MLVGMDGGSQKREKNLKAGEILTYSIDEAEDEIDPGGDGYHQASTNLQVVIPGAT